MRITTPTPWLDHFVLTRSVEGGRRSEFYRAARRGRYLRLVEGVFIESRSWALMSADDRFLARIHATSLTSRPGILFSHFAAAALWRLPVIGDWPPKPEVTVGTGYPGPSRSAFTARQYPVPTTHVEIDGLRATALARTVIDVGRHATLGVAVAMIDAALSEKDPRRSLVTELVTRDELGAEFGRIESPRGRTRCRDALELADGLSGSPGESLSRVAIHRLGLPMPVLQQEFRDAEGLIGYVDFWWPDFGLIGEFDGQGKYLRDQLLAGRTAAEVVVAEKRREDRLRALGPRVTRWGWDVAQSLPQLSRQLRDAGLR
jgi:hypothetical protein